MKVFQISYDLYRPGQDYEALFTELKSLGTHWHFQLSSWIIVTQLSAATILDRLKPHLDSNDKLFIARLQGEAAWIGFKGSSSDWLYEKLTNVASV